MNVLITAGPTREPIDPVRYIGNRSSGRMGLALIDAALRAGHQVTAILGPGTFALPSLVCRIDVETSRQMHDAVMAEFPAHDLLIMAAAVADYRPTSIHVTKVHREGSFTLQLEATEDILAAAGRIKRPDQRTVGFSLVGRDEVDRSRQKLARKHLDLLVHNPTDTLGSETIEPTLLYPDGHSEILSCRSKPEFADILVERAGALFP